MARRLKLTPDVVAAIQARRRQGVPIADLAREFSLGIGTVHKAVKMPSPVPVPDAAGKPPKPKKRRRQDQASGRAPGRGALARAQASRDDARENPRRRCRRRQQGGRDRHQPAAERHAGAGGQAHPTRRSRTSRPQPDMVAAAAMCRDKLREMVRREVEKRRKEGTL